MKSLLFGREVSIIARNASYLLGSNWLTSSVRFIYAFCLARLLGPKLYGLWSYGISWYMAFLAMTGLGIGAILTREVGKSRENGISIVAKTLTLRTLTAIFISIVSAALIFFFEDAPEARKILLIFTIALLGRSVALWTEQVFVAYEATKYSLQIQAIFRPLEVVLGLGVLFLGGGILEIAIVHIISWWLQALNGIVLTKRNIVDVQFYYEWNGLKDIFIKGLPIGLGLVIINWMQVGPIVLYRFIADNQNSLGQLALVLQAFFIISMIPAAVSTASFPSISRAVALKSGKDRVFADKMIKSSFIFGSAFGLIGIAAAPWFVIKIFGFQYTEAGYLLGPALLIIIPWAIGTAIWRVLLAKGNFLAPTLCAGIGALVFTSIMPWAVSSMQTAGVIFSLGAGMGCWALSMILILSMLGGIDVRHSVLYPSLSFLLALGLFFIIEPISRWIALLTSIGTLLVGILVSSNLTPGDRAFKPSSLP
ncbi:oligosaccharide flippase family protein [Thermodesulfobacteriota bacterium]